MGTKEISAQAVAKESKQRWRKVERHEKKLEMRKRRRTLQALQVREKRAKAKAKPDTVRAVRPARKPKHEHAPVLKKTATQPRKSIKSQLTEAKHQTYKHKIQRLTSVVARKQ